MNQFNQTFNSGCQNLSKNAFKHLNLFANNFFPTPMNLHPDFREFIESLNANGVEYLLLGGYAVVMYGYVRATGDMD
ncbi:MAG: hypothetical protein AAF587_38280 [Bacteroidota bacterium]